MIAGAGGGGGTKHNNKKEKKTRQQHILLAWKPSAILPVLSDPNNYQNLKTSLEHKLYFFNLLNM